MSCSCACVPNLTKDYVSKSNSHGDCVVDSQIFDDGVEAYIESEILIPLTKWAVYGSLNPASNLTDTVRLNGNFLEVPPTTSKSFASLYATNSRLTHLGSGLITAPRVGLFDLIVNGSGTVSTGYGCIGYIETLLTSKFTDTAYGVQGNVNNSGSGVWGNGGVGLAGQVGNSGNGEIPNQIGAIGAIVSSKGSSSSAAGVLGTLIPTGTAQIDNGAAVLARVLHESSANWGGQTRGFLSYIGNAGSGTMAEFVHFLAGNTDGKATASFPTAARITKAIGLKVDNQNLVSADAYAIYTDGGRHRLKGQVINVPQAVVSAASITVTPSSSYVEIDCTNAAAAITIAKTGAIAGQMLTISNIGTQSMVFTTDANQHSTASPATVAVNECIEFVYSESQSLWLERNHG